jgi:hypothetical protein
MTHTSHTAHYVVNINGFMCVFYPLKLDDHVRVLPRVKRAHCHDDHVRVLPTKVMSGNSVIMFKCRGRQN